MFLYIEAYFFVCLRVRNAEIKKHIYNLQS